MVGSRWDRKRREPETALRAISACSVNRLRFSYLAYGLRISSDRNVPGLAERPAGDSDLSLYLDGEPEWLAPANRLPLTRQLVRRSENELHDPTFVLSVLGAEEFFRLDYSDGTRFIVDQRAQRLWGTYASPLTMEDLVTYLVGPVFGFVLRRRGMLALHASSFAFADHAVVLVGPSEAGKSTTAAALASRGETILCEDICPVAEEGSGYFIEPGYPRVCLWPDSVEKLFGAPDALPQLTPNWEKRYLPLDGERGRFATQRLPLGAVYLLGPRSPGDSVPKIEPISPREALLELVQNTYMNYLLDRTQRAAEFGALARLVERVPVRSLISPADAGCLPDFCDALLSDVRSLLAAPQPEKLVLR